MFASAQTHAHEMRTSLMGFLAFVMTTWCVRRVCAGFGAGACNNDRDRHPKNDCNLLIVTHSHDVHARHGTMNRSRSHGIRYVHDYVMLNNMHYILCRVCQLPLVYQSVSASVNHAFVFHTRTVLCGRLFRHTG